MQHLNRESCVWTNGFNGLCRTFRRWAPLLLVLTLCGCGGPDRGQLNFNGTAAAGAPMSLARISLLCARGTDRGVSQGYAQADADGAFSLSVTHGALPCLGKAQAQVAGVTVTYYAVASSTGRLNFSPLTSAIASALLGQLELDAIWDGFNDAQARSLKQSLDNGLAALSWNRLEAELQAQQIDTSGVTGHPVTDAGLLADAAHAGTGHDKVLDDIAALQLDAEALYRMAAGMPYAPLRATGRLNDSGIDGCSDIASGSWVNDLLCSAINWATRLWGPQQDALFGRDAQAKAGTLQKLGQGTAGFDFTRLGSNGRELAVQNATWSDSGNTTDGTLWDCVRDNVTGLWWEVKRNDSNHLRHKGHTYTWYNTNASTNGGNAGTTGGSTCTGLNDSSRCNTQDYVAAVNAAGLCGKNDWRLPTLDELYTLPNTRVYNPAIDTDQFPNTMPSFYWTATTRSSWTRYAWIVEFGTGFDYWISGEKVISNHQHARLVRSGP